MKQRSGRYPRLAVDGQGKKVVSGAGGVLLTRAATTVGLDAALSTAMRPWRRPLARHDPGKVLLDLAISLAIGGDCLADIAQLRAHPQLFGPVASDPTVSRLIDTLAANAPAALAAINTARAAARRTAWSLAGKHAPDHEIDAARPLVIDVDATLVTAHSEKEQAAPTFKRGFGFHPLCAFVDHGPEGTGEPLCVLLRRGNAGSNTVADHITVIRAALAQLPGHGRRPGKNVLIRVDGAGGTHGLIDWLTRRRLAYSVGFSLPGDLAAIQKALTAVPVTAWTPAYDADRQVRPGAWVAEVTGLFDLTGWPPGMRLIVRKETAAPRCAAADHRPRRAPDHRLRHQHHPWTARRPRAPAPPPGPRRGPHPLRQGHRPDQPPAARLCRQPDLVRHRGARRRPHGLDADPRPDRPLRPALGAQAAAPAAVGHRRTPRHHRSADLPAPGPTGAVHRPGPRRPPPPRRPGRPRLTPAPPAPTTSDRPDLWNPATTPTTRGDLSHPDRRITDHGGQGPAASLTRTSYARSGLTGLRRFMARSSGCDETSGP